MQKYAAAAWGRIRKVSACADELHYSLVSARVNFLWQDREVLAISSRMYRFFVLTLNFATAWIIREALTDNREVLENSLKGFQLSTSSQIKSALCWLDHWPVGLKLNTPLSHFFCTRLVNTMDDWQYALPVHFGCQAYSLLTFSAIFGLSAMSAIAADLLSVWTGQLFVCHWVLRRIFVWQRSTLHSLWNLFRGKRWNVLRKRTDSYEYELDQLFLGTLLFTVSAFLFPTVLMYYSFFAVLSLLVQAVHWCLKTPRIILHHAL